MIKKYLQKSIINRKLCICKNKLKQKINFGNLPLINNYKTKKNLIKYPVVISQCEKCFLIQLKYSVSDKFLQANDPIYPIPPVISIFCILNIYIFYNLTPSFAKLYSNAN